MTKRQKALVIDGWSRGMGASTHTGFGFLRGDVDSIPGALAVKYRCVNKQTAAYTASAGNDNWVVKIVKNLSNGNLYKIIGNGNVTTSTNLGDT